MRDFIEGSGNVDCQCSNCSSTVDGSEPCVVLSGEKIRGAQARAESELVGGEQIALLQVVHYGRVNHLLHDF